MAQAPGDAGVMNNYGCFLQDRGKVAEAEEVLQVVIGTFSLIPLTPLILLTPLIPLTPLTPLIPSRWHTCGCRMSWEMRASRCAVVVVVEGASWPRPRRPANSSMQTCTSDSCVCLVAHAVGVRVVCVCVCVRQCVLTPPRGGAAGRTAREAGGRETKCDTSDSMRHLSYSCASRHPV